MSPITTETRLVRSSTIANLIRVTVALIALAAALTIGAGAAAAQTTSEAGTSPALVVKSQPNSNVEHAAATSKRRALDSRKHKKAKKKAAKKVTKKAAKKANSLATRKAPRATASSSDPVIGLGAGSEDVTASDPSGVPMPEGDLPGWHQEFADNFPASQDAPVGSFGDCAWGSTMSSSDCSDLPSADQSKWFAYPDGMADTSHDGKYEPSQDVSVEKGMLDMNIHTNPITGTPGVVALEPKIGGSDGQGQLYGVYSVRMRSDTVAGYGLAFLLWPDSNDWPKDAEVDFPETDDQIGGDANAFLHWMGATSGTQQTAYNTNVSTTAWHTYTIEWTPSYIRFLIDGRTIGESTSHLPTTPMHWVLQTGTSTEGVMPSASASGNVQVAWVTAYSWDGSQPNSRLANS